MGGWEKEEEEEEEEEEKEEEEGGSAPRMRQRVRLGEEGGEGGRRRSVRGR